jgi:threonine synthase
MAEGLECSNCGRHYDLAPMFRGCPVCRGQEIVAPLFVVTTPDDVRAAWDRGAAAGAGMWDYRDALPLPADADPVTLGEGNTLMLPVSMAGLPGETYLKIELRNPTGSFKDRLNSVAVSMARYHGFRGIVCSSTGNHGASLAAYARAGGLRCVVLLPEEAPPVAAEDVRRSGGLAVVTPWSERAAWVTWLVEKAGFAVSGRNFPRQYGNPYGIEGYKTIAYEIVRDLGRVPGAVFMPVAGGDGIYGVWRGFVDLQRAGVIQALPKMIGCQPEISASVYEAFRRGAAHVEAVDLHISQALSLTDERGGDHGLWAIKHSDGGALALTEREIGEAVEALAALGVHAEAASATAFAGLRKHVARAAPPVVCILTGRSERWKMQAQTRSSLRHPEELREWLGREWFDLEEASR